MKFGKAEHKVTTASIHGYLLMAAGAPGAPGADATSSSSLGSSLGQLQATCPPGGRARPFRAPWRLPVDSCGECDIQLHQYWSVMVDAAVKFINIHV